MRLLVTGGRYFSNRQLLHQTLDLLHAQHPFTVVIHGAAGGADELAGQWANANQVPIEAYPAEWRRYGRAAGVLRNTAMLNSGPDLVVAFPGGKGTADMVRKAEQAGLNVVVIDDPSIKSGAGELPE